MIKILHNPRCGKSREGLAFIEQTGKSFELVKYLESPLTFEEINELIIKLNVNPIELIRRKESVWIEKFKDKNLSDKEIIQAIADHPILMERPIVINGSKAVIGRPPETIKKIV